MRGAKLWLLLLPSLLALPAFSAEPIPPSPIAKTELVMDASHAGVHFTLPKGWDIYWQNPGDSGIPTTLAFELPKGATAGDLQWPVPERIEVSGLTNYGYHNEVTLVAPLEGTPKGDITIKANWLICRDICIPESATLTGTLPGVAVAEKIAAAQKKVPLVLQSADPKENNLFATFSPLDTTLELSFLVYTEGTKITGATWLPIQDGVIQNSAKQHFSIGDERNTDYTRINIDVARGSEPLPLTYPGVLVYETAKGKVATQVSAHPNAAMTKEERLGNDATVLAPSETQTTAPDSLISLLLFAFLGGLILNVMPCVLPILALKALAVAKKADSSRAAAARQGLSYAAGVLASFLLIAGLMLALKASGAAIGWGFQLQNTPFVIFLGLVMVAVGANLSGFFELPVLFGEKATGVDDNSLRGSFLTGVLAVLVATPCTAPFMATALGATLLLDTLPALSVFASLGLGMASPFLLISIWPAARRLLPKPGAWMNEFKKLLAVPMYMAGAWLFWVAFSMHGGNQLPSNSLAYDAATLTQLRAEGTPVLVDATAAWCITCKLNENVAIKTESMQRFFSQHHVKLMVADWTHADPAITAYLASFGRNGVPLYVYYPPLGEPVVLPQILTPAIMREAIAPTAE